MSRQSRQARRLDAIRSVSLEDIVKGRHTRWRRFLKRAKPGLIAISLAGLTAAAGSAGYHLMSSPGDGVQVADAPSLPRLAPAHAQSAAPQQRLASVAAPAEREAGPKPYQHPEPALDLSEYLTEEHPAPEITEPKAVYAAETDAESDTELARAPRPRPDDAPIVTGSIKRAERPYYRDIRRAPPLAQLSPCRLVNQVARTLKIPRRCGG